LTEKLTEVFILNKIIIAVVCVLLTACNVCTSARVSKSLASGAIGCPVKEIKISKPWST
jgi:hypothetical protein